MTVLLSETTSLNPKPRLYKGQAFRSTLEARWAIMFDELGWQWTYEPFKVVGETADWVPDFILEHKLLVEVKPFTSLQQFVERTRYQAAIARYERREILLLGADVMPRAELHDSPAIGWLLEGPDDVYPSHAVLWSTDKGYGVASDESSWVCRFTGEYEGGSGIIGPAWSDIRQKWFRAGDLGSSLPEAELPSFPEAVI